MLHKSDHSQSLRCRAGTFDDFPNTNSCLEVSTTHRSVEPVAFGSVAAQARMRKGSLLAPIVIASLGLVVEIARVLNGDLVSLVRPVHPIARFQDLLGNAHVWLVRNDVRTLTGTEARG